MPLFRLFAAILSSSAIVFLQLPLLAQPAYVPRQGDIPRRTEGSGARGCMNASTPQPPTKLTLLSVYQTESTTLGHPTFFWNLSGQVPMPVEFALVDTKNHKTLMSQRFEQGAAGITAVSLPADQPDLVPGVQYRWSVALICNEARRSSDVIAQGFIQRVTASDDLMRQLAAATSDREKAEIYAKNSFWLDSMAAYQAALAADPNNSQIMQDRLSLLEQVGLTNIAQQERQYLGLDTANQK